MDTKNNKPARAHNEPQTPAYEAVDLVVPSLEGPTAEMPGRQEQPVEIEGTPAGQLIVAPPTTLPVPTRQRLVWLRTLLKNPKALTGFAIVAFFIILAVFAPIIAPGDPSEFV